MKERKRKNQQVTENVKKNQTNKQSAEYKQDRPHTLTHAVN